MDGAFIKDGTVHVVHAPCAQQYAMLVCWLFIKRTTHTRALSFFCAASSKIVIVKTAEQFRALRPSMGKLGFVPTMVRHRDYFSSSFSLIRCLSM